MSAPLADAGLLATLARLERAARVFDGAVVLVGDVLVRLRDMPDASVQCIVTSPPYLDARDYGVAPTAWPETTYRPRFDLDPITVPATACCLGHEPTLAAYVAHLLAVARELRRVLRPDGVLWLNLGAGFSSGTTSPRKPTRAAGASVPSSWKGRCHGARVTGGLAAKQLIRAPSAACDALQADGWFVRDEIVWHKPAPTPSNVRDRCVPAHEALFLLAPSPRYRVHLDRLATPAKAPASRNARRRYGVDRDDPGDHRGASVPWSGETARPRNVWTIETERYRGGHHATFPTELARRCVVAGSDPGDVVLDPFAGSGTVLAVAALLGRVGVGVEAQGSYVARMPDRAADVARRLARSTRSSPRPAAAPDDGPLFAAPARRRAADAATPRGTTAP